MESICRYANWCRSPAVNQPENAVDFLPTSGSHRWGYGGGKSGAGGAQILRENDLRIFPPRPKLQEERVVLALGKCVSSRLRLAHMPMRWKLRQIAILVAQLPLLLMLRRCASHSLRIVGRAMRDGWVGRLGPAPDDLFARE